MVILSPEQKEQNREEQLNENELLLTMYDSAEISDDNSVITITIRSKYFLLVLRCLFHELYPSHEVPIFTIIDVTSTASSHVVDTILLENECGKMFSSGEAVVYQWIVYITDYLESLDTFIDENSAPQEPEDTENDEIIADMENLKILENEFNANELKSNFEVEPEVEPEAEIFTGSILSERKSHFQAHVCKVKSKDDVDRALRTLLLNPKIADATHNIMAYRYTNESGTMAQDYDDDGENKAGGRLLELIDLMAVENLMVVVSRWYGGVMLGPSRFKCINNIAKDTIVESGFYSPSDSKKKKKRNK